ncbi:MAG: type I restriction-modification system subunit M [Bacilli bacterium]|nr:type I restriction-modification system subunit M [Bacilli bacterium]
MNIDTNKIQDQALELSNTLWNISNTLRGGMDSSEFKNYILGTIFYRYLSERTEKYMETLLREDNLTYKEAYNNLEYKETVEKWSLEHLGYIIKPQYLFNELNRKIVKPINDNDKFSIEDYEQAISDLIGSTLGQKSEEAFTGLFDDMRLQDTRLGDSVSERSDKIGKVISRIAEIDMDLDNQSFDVLGTAYMILIGLFQSDAGKKGGEFFTPVGPSTLCATLATIGLDEAKTVGDCTCGSASMLLDVKKHLTTGRVGHFYGQENNPTTYNLARMNMLMHGVDYQNFSIRKGDTLLNDTYDEEKMTVQVCNPPYSLKWDSPSTLLDDPRFSGVGKLAPKSAADLAFVEHMIYHMDETDGRVAVLLPLGVLFRGGAEEDIRKYIIKDLNRLDAVIGLPANLFHGAAIPVCILVLKSNRNGNSNNILFIDASKEFKSGRNQNELTNDNIEKIINTYVNRVDVDKYAHVASIDEIVENDYNLNIPRYVNSIEDEEQVDISDTKLKLIGIENRKKVVLENINKTLDILGL